MKAVVKVDSKGRITIPLYIREAVGLEPDSYVEIELIENYRELRIRPLTGANEILADISVELEGVGDIHRLIDEVVKEGADIRLLKCRSVNSSKYSCNITVGIIDANLVKIIKTALTRSKFTVHSVSIISRGSPT